MRKGNNVSPPPLDVLSFRDVALCQQRFGRNGFCQAPAGSPSVSGQGNLSLRCSPAGFNSVAGHTQEIGKG